MTSLLTAQNITAGYGESTVLRNVSVHVEPGEAVVVLGANGAGKSTLMSVLSGTLPFVGELMINGARLVNPRPDKVLAHGVSLVPQGRGTLSSMTVLENLRVGAVSRRGRHEIENDIERWFDVFPRLRERSGQVAGTLSGGEQQMLAVARALMSRPQLLLCDEVSLGLAPVIVQGLFDTLRDINRESGTALLLVEQNAELAMDIASRVYLLEVGEVTASGSVDEFRENDSIRAAYLGY